MQKKHSPRRTGRPDRRIDPIVFAIASLIAAAVLVTLVAVPQYLSKQARLDVLRGHVGEIGRIAASVVDGDLHRRLLDPDNYSDQLYDEAVAPLVRLHSADPDIFYLYTMVERDGVPYFVLDTAASSNLKTEHPLEASGYMEEFEVREETGNDWLRDIAAGNTYVTPSFEQDDYGTFLTAHVPIYDSKGRYSGFVGVDFDTQYYQMYEARFRTIAIASLVGAMLLALLVGYLVARYHAAMQRRIRELYESSIHDSLTGLYNRRGVMEVIKKDLETRVGKSALLLVDIDNLSAINDARGHVAGDAVLARTSEAIRNNLRDGDLCGRFGDEFIVYAPGCDAAAAAGMAQKVLTSLSKEGMPLARADFSVSIGVATCDNDRSEFARMYREAEEALRGARSEGRNRVGIAPAWELCGPQEGSLKRAALA